MENGGLVLINPPGAFLVRVFQGFLLPKTQKSLLFIKCLKIQYFVVAEPSSESYSVLSRIRTLLMSNKKKAQFCLREVLIYQLIEVFNLLIIKASLLTLNIMLLVCVRHHSPSTHCLFHGFMVFAVVHWGFRACT